MKLSATAEDYPKVNLRLDEFFYIAINTEFHGADCLQEL